MASIQLHRPEQLPHELRGIFLDELERRALAEGLLVRQVLGEDELTYAESDGCAFRGCPVVLDQASVERRGRLHDQHLSAPRPTTATPATRARELSTPLATVGAWTFEGPEGGKRVHMPARTWFAARQLAALTFGCEVSELRLVRSPQ